MTKQEELVIENMARVGYQTMHDSRWDNPEMDSIELALWRTVAANMLAELRRTWELAKQGNEIVTAKDGTKYRNIGAYIDSGT